MTNLYFLKNVVQPPPSVKLSNPLSSYSFSYDYIGRLETMSDDDWR